jgi:hypothetical protein
MEKPSVKNVDLVCDLDTWQASSHPKLACCPPEELFVGSFVERYQRLHEDLWQRIIRLHGTVFTLEQLKRFPLDYLYPLVLGLYTCLDQGRRHN